MQLEIEKSALLKEKDNLSRQRLEKIEEELSEAKDQQTQIMKTWESEKNQINKVKELRIKLESNRNDLQNAFNNQDYETAAKLQYSVIPELEKEIKNLLEATKNHTLISETVTSDQIAEIVSKWTHIPVTKLMQADRDKLINLKSELQKRVIGQDHALELVSEAIIRQRSGIKNDKKPIGTFLFLGPTGVGKTEVARALAYNLFDDDRQIIRIDMSEYMERHSVSRLIGAPPGYVGYDEGGQLTESVRRKPYSIVLLDEIEKAHPDVFNILLQIMDDGRLTDNQGRTVDFKNTIIIMTSNLGSEYLLNGESESKVIDLVKRTFKPEFINRLDEIIVFNPLSKEVQIKITEKLLTDLTNKLKSRDILVSFDHSVRDQVIKDAYSEEYGARPLIRYIEKHIETLIAKLIIKDEIKPNHEYIMIYEGEYRLKD